MARRPSLRKQIEALTEAWGPEIRKAFLAGVDDLRAGADLQAIIEAIQRKDIDAAIRAVNLDPAAFNSFDRAVAASFNAGGTVASAAITSQARSQGLAVVFRFNVRNPRAEQWLSDHSSTMVTRIMDDQRVAIRNALTAGMEAGINPRSMALDIVGRIDRTTGRRVGGIVGLTSQQETFARNALDELMSGDRAAMQNYFTRGRRDKRFDRTVLKAMNEGVGLSRSEAERIVGRYRDRLLQLRGETIARLEAKASLHRAEQESFLQAVDTGTVQQQDIKRRWRHTGGREPRVQHVQMDGQTVGLNEPFIAPDGTRIMYPCDPNAPVAHTANCRCQVSTSIDFIAALAREELADA